MTDGPVEFGILGTTRVMAAFGGGVVRTRLADIEPIAYRFLVNFAKDNELQVREGRGAERTRLAEMQRVGDTA